MTYLLLALACGPRLPPETREPAPTEPAAAPEAAEPVHPGTITFVDLDSGESNDRSAADVPETVAWVVVDGARVPVVRVEARQRGEDQREIAKYGVDGQLLETTTQVRRP